MKYICGAVLCVGSGALYGVQQYLVNISNTISRIFADLSHNISHLGQSLGIFILM